MDQSLDSLTLLRNKDARLAFELMCLEIEPMLRAPSSYAKIDLSKEAHHLVLYGAESKIIESQMLSFLKTHVESHLYILEEDRAHLMAFLETSLAQECLNHPRIHFDAFLSQDSFDRMALNLLPGPYTWVTPFEKGSELYERSKEHETQLQGSFSQLHAHMSLYKHFGADMARSMLTHLLDRADKPFYWGPSLKEAFKGYSAIVCGAGPSLKEALPWLKEVQSKCMIIGAGSAISMLQEVGITPDLAVAIDPNPPLSRYPHKIEAPLCYQFQLEPNVAAQGASHHLLWGVSELFPFEGFFMRQLGLSDMVMSVGTHAGTFAAHIAAHLGFSYIHLVGMEGCSHLGKQYGFEVDEATVGDMSEPAYDFKGRPVMSKPDFIQGTKVIEALIRAYPQTQFSAFSDRGLKIEGCSLSKQIQLARALSKEERAQRFEKVEPLLLTTARLEQGLKSLKATLNACLEYNKGVLAWCEKHAAKKELPSLPSYQESLLVTEPFFDEVVLAMWQVFKPMLVKEEDRLIETVQRSLFVEEVLKAYLEVVEQVEVRDGAV